ncbi:MAG: caspase family protein [Hyphomicrobiaceae bacterium]
MNTLSPRAVLAGLATLIALLSAAATPAAAARHAFIVGNSNYASVPRLQNPANDAQDLAKRLEALDYRVTLGLDLGRAGFLQRFQSFVRALRSDDVALFYYAGHGLQIGGENYLFPVDATVSTEADARRALIPLNALISDLSRSVKTRLVLLDACRNNPFAEKLADNPSTRSAGDARGLARVYAGVGSFIAYSTQPGNVALDGQGRNSPFTEALLRHMSDAGADVHAVMRRVRADVGRATSDQQVPWENSSLIEEMAFAASALLPATPAPSRPASAGTATNPPPEPFRTTVVASSYAYVTGLDPNGDNFLALRTSPTGEGTRIATMGPDTLLQILETRGVWRRVALLDGTTGWAHGNWIKCCRTIGAARPAQFRPPSPSQPAESCDDLWHRRNAVWHRNGYCFTGAKGQRTFGNQGCSRDLAGARAVMSPSDRALVDAIDAREKALGCK